ARVHHHVGDAGLVADLEDALPGAAAVVRAIEAAVAAVLPQRALRGDEDAVGVGVVDEDLADVLGILEPDAVPAGAAVGGLVDAVAVADAALAVVLAGAHPDDERVLGVEHDGADREALLAVEDRLPGGAAVGRVPDASGGGGDVAHGVVRRVDGEVDDAARGERRADLA